MKEAHGTGGAAGAPWGGVDGAARSHGGMLLLAAHHRWVSVGVTVPTTTYLGPENHPAEWVNLKMLVR